MCGKGVGGKRNVEVYRVDRTNHMQIGHGRHMCTGRSGTSKRVGRYCR